MVGYGVKDAKISQSRKNMPLPEPEPQPIQAVLWEEK